MFKLQYQDKALRIVPTGAATIQSFHLGQKYATNVLVIKFSLLNLVGLPPMQKAISSALAI